MSVVFANISKISARDKQTKTFFSSIEKKSQILFFTTEHFDIEPSNTEKFKHNNDNKHTIMNSRRISHFKRLKACFGH